MSNNTLSDADAFELIRWELAHTAREYEMACPRVLIEMQASTGPMWEFIAHDFKRMAQLRYHSARIMRYSQEAAEYLAKGNIAMAMMRLAQSCGYSVGEWIVATKMERERAEQEKESQG